MWLKRRRIVATVAICAAAAIAVAVAAAVVDEYARSEVKTRVEAAYFPELRRAVVEEVKKKLPFVCNEQAGVGAAERFLEEERRHITLQVDHEPDWGWQIERYRFTIQWRHTWVAVFKVYRTQRVAIVRENERTIEEFVNKLKAAICKPACGGAVCTLGEVGEFLGLL